MELSFAMYLLAPNGVGGCHAVAVANGERFSSQRHWRIDMQLTRCSQQMFTTCDERELFNVPSNRDNHTWLCGREIFLYVPVMR
jgi:hypothetical protein